MKRIKYMLILLILPMVYSIELNDGQFYGQQLYRDGDLKGTCFNATVSLTPSFAFYTTGDGTQPVSGNFDFRWEIYSNQGCTGSPIYNETYTNGITDGFLNATMRNLTIILPLSSINSTELNNTINQLDTNLSLGGTVHGNLNISQNLTVEGHNITFGSGVADQDIRMLFLGESNTGEYYWDEDNSRFIWNNNFLLFGSSNIFFRGTGNKITSPASNELDITATSMLRLAGAMIEVQDNANFTKNITINGEILPDGEVCLDNQILIRSGDSNWDCINNVGFNSTIVNNSISHLGVLIGFNSTFNESYDNKIDSADGNNTYILQDGTKELIGNWVAGAFNITAQTFKGVFNWVIGTTSTNFLTFNGTELDFNETHLNDTIDNRGVLAGFNVTSNETSLIEAVNTTANIQGLLNDTGIYSTFNSSYLTSSDKNSGLYVNYTNTTLTGNLSSGTNLGYIGGNALCESEVATGSHMCTMDELVNTINKGVISNLTATFRVSEGAPGFTADANDCSGWDSSTSTALGSIWVSNTADANDAGAGGLVACNVERAIACCI